MLEAIRERNDAWLVAEKNASLEVGGGQSITQETARTNACRVSTRRSRSGREAP
jgi:hypothetical protein